MPPRKLLHLALPLALILLTSLLLSGCLYLPLPPTVVSGSDVWQQIGPRDSHAPLRVHVSSRAQVLARLGPPSIAYAHDPHHLLYSAQRRVGYYALCFFPHQALDDVSVILTFDNHGILQRAQRTVGLHGRPSVVE